MSGSDVTVVGNYIGTDVTGTVALGNGLHGVELRGSSNQVASNLISGNNGCGVRIYGGDGNTVEANLIGTAASGMAPLGNGLAGVLIDATASGHIIGGNTAGAANVIAFNFGAGVAIQPWISSSGRTYVPQQNMSRLNSIHSNGELGIDLNGDGVTPNDTGDPDTGPNELQNFPLIRGVSLDGGNSTVSGTINSTPNTSFTIDLYGNNVGDPSGHGEGEVYLGTTTAVTDATGDGTWSLLVAGDVTGLVLSATVTSPDGNTFEFSQPTIPNIPPYAAADAYSVDEEGTLSVAAPGVLGNDSDSDGDALTALLVSGPSNGTLTLNANGSFTYTPDADFNGTDTFTYKANDGTQHGNPATVTLTVNPVNDTPVAVADAYSMDEDNTLNVGAPGVLDNDSDVDGDALTAVLASGPANGTLTLNSDGSFTYTPNADFSGTDSFTYKANDGTADSNIATVTITVHGLNDPPVAADDAYGVDEDSTLDVAAPGVLAYDSDLDGDALTAVVVSDPPNGRLTLNADGSFVYTPKGNFHGTDTFTYRANDGTADSNMATVTITVNGLNDPPVAEDDAYGVDEDSTLAVAAPGVLGNDSDSDGDALTALLVSGPSNGTLTLNTNGSFTYTPDTGFSGTDVFTYKANDGTEDSNTATVTITVGPVSPNRSPTVGQIIAPLDPNQVGTQITASADFTDPDTLDTHTAVWDWGDGSTSAGVIIEPDPATGTPGSVGGSHTYTAAESPETATSRFPKLRRLVSGPWAVSLDIRILI